MLLAAGFAGCGAGGVVEESGGAQYFHIRAFQRPDALGERQHPQDVVEIVNGVSRGVIVAGLFDGEHGPQFDR